MKTLIKTILLAALTISFGGRSAPAVAQSNDPKPASKPARITPAYPLKISANGRSFVDQNGKPFFYLGDTCWLLFQRLNRE